MLVASDFHGSLDKVNRFLDYKPEELHVFCGDILDSRAFNNSRQIDCLNKLIEQPEDKLILLLGNHEMSYLNPDQFACSGFQYNMASTFNQILWENIERFKVAYSEDNYICTHAGINESLAIFDDPKAEVDFLNNEFNYFLDDEKFVIQNYSIFDIGISRGGTALCGGIFWHDHLRENGMSEKYNQIVGHTPSAAPLIYKFNNGKKFVCINTREDAEDLYAYDTKIHNVIEI